MTNKVIDLSELFKMQKVLDEDIIKKHKENYERHDSLYNKVYALKNEVNEAWNTTNAFKMWSVNFRKPKESFLEEMVDVLHFVLSVAMDFNQEKELQFIKIPNTKIKNFNKAFFEMDKQVNNLVGKIEYMHWKGGQIPLQIIIDIFLKIIDFAGFTWNDVVSMYKAKNEENFKRLASGY